MDIDEELPVEEKCENMMSIVVESRKRFGKMCVEYDAKCTLLENKMLKKKLDNISNYQFKVKQTITDSEYNEQMERSNEFRNEIEEKGKYLDGLKKRILNSIDVVEQLNRDKMSIAAGRLPLTATVMLARAKNRLEDQNRT